MRYRKEQWHDSKGADMTNESRELRGKVDVMHWCLSREATGRPDKAAGFEPCRDGPFTVIMIIEPY